MRFLRWPGVRYKMLAHSDHRLMYFEDQTLMGEILEVLDRRWYRRLLRWPWFGWEIEADEHEVAYYFWAPNVNIGEEIRRKILGKHPEMEITRVIEPSGDFSDCDFVAATSMKLERDYPVPVKTFYNEIIDSQAPFVNAVSDLAEGERCLIQFLIQPARNYQKDFDKALKLVKKWDKEEEYEKIELFETNISAKQTKQLAHCAIRIMTGAKNKIDANRIRAEVTRSFGQFKSEALNSFMSREKWTHIKPILLKQVKHRLFPMIERRQKRMILNIEEMSAVVRLPSGEVNNSRLTRLRLKQIEAPSGVIKMSQAAKENGAGARYLHIGQNHFRMRKTDAYIDLNTLKQHLLILGASNTGKSVLLVNALLELCNLKLKGYKVGFFLIDPLGGLAQELASNIPEELHHLVNFVQPDPLAEIHFPFNLFDVDFATTEKSVASNIANAIGRIWPQGWGPRPEQNFILCGIALQRLGEASIINLDRLIRDQKYTISVYQRAMKHPDLVERGVTEYLMQLIAGAFPNASAADKRLRSELTESTKNKLIHFTMSNMLNGSMGAKTCGFRWLESMNNGYINILDLSKIQDNAEKQMMGSLALTMNYQAAISRTTVDDNMLYLIVADELPMLVESNAKVINEMADQTRQKNVPIIGAAQGIITQLDEKAADAIARNFSTHIVFRLNHTEDAEWMATHFNLPKLHGSDLKQTPSNYAYARVGLDREPSPPFSILTNPPKYKAVNVEKLKKLAQDTIDRALGFEEKTSEAVKEKEQDKDQQAIDISNFMEKFAPKDKAGEDEKKKNVPAETSDSAEEFETALAASDDEINLIDLTKDRLTDAGSQDDLSSTKDVSEKASETISLTKPKRTNQEQEIEASDEDTKVKLQDEPLEEQVENNALPISETSAKEDIDQVIQDFLHEIDNDENEKKVKNEQQSVQEERTKKPVVAEHQVVEDDYDLTINFKAIGKAESQNEKEGVKDNKSQKGSTLEGKDQNNGWTW